MDIRDLDYCELHLTIRNWYTLKPYVDTTTGVTSLDMDYDTLTWTDAMYEPRKAELSTAKITLPSLVFMPEMQTLYQKIKEGDRVELYNFQPDCGDPVFAGYIPQEGITQQDGVISIDVHDPMVQGKWQHVRRIEEFNDSVGAFYTRGLSHYTDICNEDFQSPGALGTLQLNLLTSMQSICSSLAQQPAACGWVAGANTTIIIDGVGAQPLRAANLTGQSAIQLKATLAGSVTASASYPYTRIQPNTLHTAYVYFKAATTPRSCTVQVQTYDDNGTLLTTYTSAAITDTLTGVLGTGWNIAQLTFTSGATATQAVLVANVSGLAAGEIHLISAAYLYPGTSVQWRLGMNSPQPWGFNSDGLWADITLLHDPAGHNIFTAFPFISYATPLSLNGSQPGTTFVVEATLKVRGFGTPGNFLTQTGNSFGNEWNIEAFITNEDFNAYALALASQTWVGGTNAWSQREIVQAFDGNNFFYPPAGSSISYNTTFQDFSNGVQLRYVVSHNTDGSYSLRMYLDNIEISFVTGAAANFLASPIQMYPAFYFIGASPNTILSIGNLRARQITPYITKAGRFVPQTADAVQYIANNESCYDFFNLFVEKDNAEYRIIPKMAPAQDLIELDAVNTLGNDVSATLAYLEPGGPPGGSPQVSPIAARTERANFLMAPPFRFEEGHNMVGVPKQNSKDNPHANEIIRMGSGDLDAQSFANAYSTKEVGNPGQGIIPTYPYFEQLSNDDRVGLQNVSKSLARYDLNRATDPTPSLEVQVADQVEFSGRWRAGDSVWVKTRSLSTNLEGYERIMKVTHTAGSPLKTVTLGKLPDRFDTSQLTQDMIQSWLYSQAGSSAQIYPYPNVPTSSFPTPNFVIQLDQFTTGTQIVYAALHWFTSSGVVSLVSASINGSSISTTAAGNDSGLIPCTGFFQTPGQYTLNFTGSGATLASAFLVIRIKI